MFVNVLRLITVTAAKVILIIIFIAISMCKADQGHLKCTKCCHELALCNYQQQPSMDKRA